jgi:hypothetical protein
LTAPAIAGDFAAPVWGEVFVGPARAEVRLRSSPDAYVAREGDSIEDLEEGVDAPDPPRFEVAGPSESASPDSVTTGRLGF